METQQSISKWANDTFGEPGSELRMVTRAGEEMFEIFKDICQGQPAEKIIEECADVAIVLARVCERNGISSDFSMISRSDPDNLEWLAAEANAKLASVIVMFVNTGHQISASYSLKQVYYFLNAIVVKLGGNLFHAIDAKMAINRGRKWNVGADGHGYHV